MIDNILVSYADLGGGVTETNYFRTKIDILPNPMDNSSTLKFDNFSNEPLTLTVFNSLGQKLKQIDNIVANQIHLEREGLPSGLYLVQLKGPQNIIAAAKLMMR